MTIFFEPNLLALETSDDAAQQLDHLADTGAELVVLSDRPLPEWEALGVSGLRFEPTVESGRRGDWWLTADPEDCGRRPGHGVHSVLIGGVFDPGPGGARCDMTARDLRGAVLEILSREAMPEGMTAAAH